MYSHDHKKPKPSTSSFTSQQNPPNPPPRPWPLTSFTSTAAFAWRSRSTTESWPLRAVGCSGVLPQEPQPEASHRQNPNEGEKFLRWFWCLKSKFWKLGPLIILSGLKLALWFWDVLMTPSWLKKLLPLDFGSQDDVDNEPKHIYSNSG